MDEQTTVGTRPDDAERPRESGSAAPGRGGRMSRQRKTTAVLRLLRGEDLETVSRGLGVTAALRRRSAAARMAWLRSGGSPAQASIATSLRRPPCLRDGVGRSARCPMTR
jgi:hypothetical protein